MIINNKQEFANSVNKFQFKYAKTYSNKAPHEYIIVDYNSEHLDTIRSLNKYIQDYYDEIEKFWNKEYKVLYVNDHKYWSVEDYKITNILNRNWDYKNEDGTTNKSITDSYLGKYDMQGVIMNNKIVVEVGFLLTKPLNYYHNLIINAGGINTYNCETHDIYWTDKNLDGLSENQMKKSCVRFRRSRGLSGKHYDGNDNWKSEFQNYNVYNKNHEDKFPCDYEDIEKYEIEFNKKNFIRVFDTHKIDYQYMIGNMKSRIQIQLIDEIGLVLYYDNPDYYDLDLEKQREAIIRELNIYGFYFKFDQLGIDKLRSLFYKESKFSTNQND